MKNSLLLLFIAAAGLGSASAAPVNLTTWTKEGPAGNGNWVVSGDGSSVLQTINGNPTFFVSPTSFLNGSFNGQFRVETTADDDFIGFVLFSGGVNDPFYLFDWKQTAQSGSPAGFYLSLVTGGAAAIPFGNHHLDAAGYDVLLTDTGTGKGWKDNTTYGFSLEYTATNLKIGISGDTYGTGTTIFNFAGTFQPARFGFYNYSQQSVRYQGFVEEALPVPDSGSSLLLTSFGLLGAIGWRLRRSGAQGRTILRG